MSNHKIENYKISAVNIGVEYKTTCKILDCKKFTL